MSDRYNYQNKIRWFKFVWLLLNKKFRIRLRDTIYYGLNNQQEKRGEGASDVLFFEINYADKIIKEQK